MQIQRREGLADMYICAMIMRSQGIVSTKNFELSLVPNMTHQKFFQPFLHLLEVVKAWEQDRSVYEFDIRQNEVNYAHTFTWNYVNKGLPAHFFSQHQW